MGTPDDRRSHGQQQGDPDALRRVAARFEQALRAARAGAWEWQVGTSEAFWSDENYELMGLDPSTGVASFDAWLSAVHPDDREAARRAVEQAVEDGADLDIEFRVLLPDGRIRWLRDVGKMVSDPDGNPVGMYGIQMDITERQTAELARQQAESQLRRAQRLESIGTLAGGVAHDFNNLLTIILSAADALVRRNGDLAGAAELAEIRDATQRATSLTRQLLAFSRRRAGKPRVLDLSDLVSQLVPMMRRLIREDVELELRLATPLPCVKVDPVQMDQVVMNLVVNARDAMPEGGVLTVETWAEQEPPGPGWVLLRVADTGVGMDEETTARVFDPFFTTKGPSRGTGLGLATVYGIVAQADGEVDVQSRAGEGAAFLVRLPVTTESLQASAEAPPAPRLEPRGTVVLLVEDDPSVGRVVKRALAGETLRVLRAHNADEALQIASEHEAPIDLLLTDVVMPGASGVELAERLMRERPGLRVLYMSGYAGEELERRGVSASVPFVEKPFTTENLLEGVRKALS